ncbi:MAG: hypothetical protein KDA20_03305 [Phycisphaerales bacterium]|nr:hypothetical protein [Phycisphaerales bacterium]
MNLKMLSVGVLLLCGAAQAALIEQYQLFDHPDGDVNPPPYGLRFDNIFVPQGGPSGIASFSMDNVGDTTLSVFDDGGGSYRIQIAGTLYGGVDAGSTYGYGEGLYDLFFEYAANVAPSGTGWVVDPSSALNAGTLTSQGNADVPSGYVFTFEDKSQPSGESFLFLQDDHRLQGHPQEGQGFWVGRGWVMGAQYPMGTQDFLFIAEKIPAPGAMSVLGFAGLAAVRRRR